ncbi:MAG: ATP-binding cassette domain-containing protein [Ignavibacteriaceae bacterium]
MNILEVRSVSYKPEENSIITKVWNDLTLRNISFSMQKGDILGIAGESGSGKTTLAKLIVGLNTPSSGEIIINRSAEWEKTRVNPVQILFQNNGEILNPFRKIFDIVSETALNRNKNLNKNTETERIFELVNIPKELWDKKGFQLSGGEQQRAALARIIAAKPELLILDEPFSAQDPESQVNFMELFKRINAEFNISMICISHNLKILKNLCSKLLVMYNGEIVEQGNCKEIFDSPSHQYTQYLIRAENYELSHEELKYIP